MIIAMRTLFLATGNTLRGDDGAAPEVIRMIRPAAGRQLRAVQQLTPELAEEMARFDCVVFLDADVAATEVKIEPVGSALRGPLLAHVATPAEIVALSRALFGFVGAALLCRIPARQFGLAGSLSPGTRTFAEQAAEKLESFL